MKRHAIEQWMYFDSRRSATIVRLIIIHLPVINSCNEHWNVNNKTQGTGAGIPWCQFYSFLWQSCQYWGIKIFRYWHGQTYNSSMLIITNSLGFQNRLLIYSNSNSESVVYIMASVFVGVYVIIGQTPVCMWWPLSLVIPCFPYLL